MGLLDTVLIETRPEIHFQTVFARCLEEEVEFWIEVGSCVYEYRDISFLLSVYGQNFEETVLEEFPVVPSTGKQLGVDDTYSEVLAKRDGTLNAQLPLPCGKGQNLYKVRIPANIPFADGNPTRRGCIKSSSSCWTRQAALLIHTAASLGSARFASRQRRNARYVFPERASHSSARRKYDGI